MKLLIVGLGSMGKRRARLTKGIDAAIQIVGVDTAESRRDEALRLGLADAAYATIGEAVAAEHPDAALVCTAPLAHAAVIGELLDSDLQGKSLLDMGCGTSILAILARMRGASPCTAIDIDEWCVRNSLENIALNGVDNIAVSQGDASSLKSKGPFDMVIANINRNILLADMKHYIARMNPGAELLMSGFYIDDIPVIREEAERNGLHFVHHREKNRWAAVKFRK